MINLARWWQRKKNLFCPVHDMPIGKRKLCPICGPRWRQ